MLSLFGAMRQRTTLRCLRVNLWFSPCLIAAVAREMPRGQGVAVVLSHEMFGSGAGVTCFLRFAIFATKTLVFLSRFGMF